MRTILKQLVGNSLSDTQLHQIIDRTISDLDVDETGKIDY